MNKLAPYQRAILESAPTTRVEQEIAMRKAQRFSRAVQLVVFAAVHGQNYKFVYPSKEYADEVHSAACASLQKVGVPHDSLKRVHDQSTVLLCKPQERVSIWSDECDHIA